MIISLRKFNRLLKKSFYQPGYAFSALKKKAGSLLTYYFFKGFSSYPETVSLFLTYNCNLACSMCGYWGKCGSLKDSGTEILKQTLSIEDLERLIDDIADFKPNITLFGGEPFLYPGWPQLIKYIKNKNMRCNVVTNGTLLSGKEKEVLESGLDEIIFSLEGPQEIHDKITNVKGAYEKAFGAVLEISKLKKQNNLKRPSINIAVTISEDNYDHLYETLQVAIQLDPESITFHHLSFVDKKSIQETNETLSKNFGVITQDWSGFLRTELPKIDTDILIREMNKIRESKNKPGIFFYPDFSPVEIKEYYSSFNFKSREYKNRCLSPWMTVYIFPDGRVGACEELNIYFGNIRQNSFKDIWNNKNFREFRQLLKKKKIFPVCTRCTELYRF